MTDKVIVSKLAQKYMQGEKCNIELIVTSMITSTNTVNLPVHYGYYIGYQKDGIKYVIMRSEREDAERDMQ